MPGRLLAISDLHIGYPENRAYAESLAPGHPDDWLIVAGDVGESFADVGFVLASLANRFARVIWTPGNHELWTLPRDRVALRGAARYDALVTVCRRFGVLTPEDEFARWPGPDGPVTVAPLFTLYDYSFAASTPADSTAADNTAMDGTAPVGPPPDRPTPDGPAPVGRATDRPTPDGTAPDGPVPDGPGDAARQAALAAARRAGITPTDEGRLHADPYPSLAAWCADRVAATERRLAEVAGPVVLVSHWPLSPAPLAALRHPEFAPWCGTTRTDGWHTRPGVLACVYGHLHIPRGTRHDGVRFEEVSIGYPREWQRRGNAPPPPRVVLGQ
jgi:predicted phosphodiesterase